MSIKLQIQPYCENCPRFEVYVEKLVGKPCNYIDMETTEEYTANPVDFNIYCKHRFECEGIAQYLRRNIR